MIIVIIRPWPMRPVSRWASTTSTPGSQTTLPSTGTTRTAGRWSYCSFGNPVVDKDKDMNWKSSCNCVFVAECCAPQSFSSQHVPKGEPAPLRSLLKNFLFWSNRLFFVTFKHFLVIPGGSSSWVSLEAYLKKTKIKQLERELLSIFITETIISTFTATTVLGYTISKRWIRIYAFSLSCVWICSFYQDVLGYMTRCVRICSLKSNMDLDI